MFRFINSLSSFDRDLFRFYRKNMIIISYWLIGCVLLKYTAPFEIFLRYLKNICRTKHKCASNLIFHDLILWQLSQNKKIELYVQHLICTTTFSWPMCLIRRVIYLIHYKITLYNANAYIFIWNLVNPDIYFVLYMYVYAVHV